MEEEEQEEAPLKEPLKIREYSEIQQQGLCIVCGQAKEPYVQIEYEDKVEYTCEECYRKSAEESIPKCGDCGAALKKGDRFCGKCGSKQDQSCPKCGAKIASEDIFCGKCGTKL
ncbi:MAG: zinc ribbon domain-containing protein [Thermoplasmata archaeon]